MGGPIAGDPGDEASTEHLLTRGQYAVVCFVPSADGKPHFSKGMVSSLEVLPGTAAPGAESMADIEVKLKDYDFEFATGLTPGRHVIKVENTSDQMHEIVIAKLNPGKTAKNLVDWGEYALICFIPDAKNGKPHIMHGMLKQITVG